MRQTIASLAPLVLALLAAAPAGCSCSNGRSQPRHDTGTGNPDNDAAIVTPSDADLLHNDAQYPDVGPPMDGGCDITTPVMNEIIGDPPDMLILLDISGSMCEPINPLGGMTKLAVMKTALTDLVTSFDARINFGLMVFPGSGVCGTGRLENGIMPHNGANIVSTISAYPTGLFGCAMFASGATPTFLGVEAAQTYYSTIPVNPVGQYVLLATDGLPNCGAEQPDGSTAATNDETVAAIQTLHDAAGIDTFVLGFGGGFAGDPTTLQRMATAGGTGTPYNARDAATLTTALNMIAAGIVRPSCTIMLDGSTRNPQLFQVSFDAGPLIPRDVGHGSGWDYDAATNTITFYGNECTAVESGTVTQIHVDYGCPGPLI